MKPADAKPKILIGQVLLLLFRYWRTMPLRVCLSVALIAATALCNMATPWAAAKLPETITQADSMTSQVALAALWLIGLYAGAQAFGFLNSFSGVVFRARIMDRLMLDIFQAIVAMPSRWLEQQAPSAMAHTAYRASRGYLLVDFFVLQIAGPSLAFLACVIITVALRWPLIGAMLAVLVLVYAVTSILFMRNFLSPRVRRVVKAETDASAAMGDSLACAGVVKDFGRESSEIDHIAKVADVRGKAYRNWQRWDASAAGFETLLLISVFAVLTGGLMFAYWDGRAVTSDLIFSVTSFSLIVSHATTLPNGFRGMVSGAGDISEGLGYMEEARKANEGVALRPPLPQRTGGLEIQLQDISFTYDGAERPVLSGLSLHIRAGEMVAIVGPSGVGKSTLARILQGRCRPQQGVMKLNGVEQEDGDFDRVVNPVAMVAQEPRMFNRSIHDNIVMGETGFDQAAVERAASLAGMHSFISTLKDGYQTIVGERGVTLSGGQRQRIAIARAFLRDMPCLVLDEPTSAVDLQTEAQLIASIRDHGKMRTVVIISHRASTIRMASRIFVLGGGRVIDEGSHDELIGRCAPYQALAGAEGETAILENEALRT